MTSTRSRIETSIPRKHGPAIAGYEAVCISFFIISLNLEFISDLESHLPLLTAYN